MGTSPFLDSSFYARVETAATEENGQQSDLFGEPNQDRPSATPASDLPNQISPKERGIVPLDATMSAGWRLFP
ncbi:hypothetical protein CPY51_07200 [Rhizobium tubonense]|uniref:Uncharacterized protein n=1 Tax=Rhizobium tubonense TaxID=484088 RepID=A0A2W4DFM2_9HYPH|nr:hypothetical protein CPY51_07200 [Rhizobium tubonense]